jgi:hypothetical protein
VSTLPPYIGSVYPDREAHQQEFNAALPVLIAARQAVGQRVTLCDVRAKINLTNAATMLCSDGVHPNQAGYDALAEVWNQAFAAVPLIEIWRKRYFGSPNPVGNAADGADWDGDGFSNLVEYAFGLNPTIAESASPVTTGFVNESGTNYLSITFPRRRNADVRYVVEAVSELSGVVLWSDRAVQVGPPRQLDAEFMEVTFRDTVPASAAPSRFMRVQAQLL